MSEALIEVEWFVPPADMYDMPYYRSCDLCEYSATDSRFGGVQHPQFPEQRRFFHQHGGDDNGLNICEACLDAYLAGTP